MVNCFSSTSGGISSAAPDQLDHGVDEASYPVVGCFGSANTGSSPGFGSMVAQADDGWALLVLPAGIISPKNRPSAGLSDLMNTVNMAEITAAVISASVPPLLRRLSSHRRQDGHAAAGPPAPGSSSRAARSAAPCWLRRPPPAPR